MDDRVRFVVETECGGKGEKSVENKGSLWITSQHEGIENVETGELITINMGSLSKLKILLLLNMYLYRYTKKYKLVCCSMP